MQNQLGEKHCVADFKEQRVHTNKPCLPSACTDMWSSQADADDKHIHPRRRYTEAVFDALPDPVIAMDLNGHIRHANQRFLHAIGRTQEQVLGKTPSEVGLLSSEQFKNEVVLKLRCDGALISIRTVVQRPDGCSFPALLSFGLLEGLPGEPETIIGTSHDMSPLEQAHKAKIEKEEALETLLLGIPESVFLLDSHGRILACNETAAKRIGRPIQELIGAVFVDYLGSTESSDLRRQHLAKVAAALHSGEPAHFTDAYDDLALEYTLCPVRDGENQAIDGIVVFGRNIAKQIQAQKELHEYCDQLCGAEWLALLGTLSVTLIHEMTQPLSVIQLANQTVLAELKELRCQDAIEQNLQASLAACVKIAVAMNRFRNYARQSVRTLPIEACVSSVASWTIRLLQHSAQQANVTVRTENLEALPAIRMSENELRQLFLSLMWNVVQAADGNKGRCVLITGVRRSDTIELVFEDNCGGIESACLPRLFEPFFTTKPPGKGMGLGLCVVRRILQQKGGQISVQNQPGEGVRFVVTLPTK